MQLPPPRDNEPRRIVLLGDHHQGKTSLIVRFVEDKFGERAPAANRNEAAGSYGKQLMVDDICHTLEIRDVDDEEGPRYQVGHAPRGPVEEAMSAAAHEIVIFVQSVRDEYWKKGANLERMVNRLRAVRGLDRREVLPVLLVATKCDLPRIIPRAELVAFAAQHRLQGYYETSAKSPANVHELFADAARLCCAISADFRGRLAAHDASVVRQELEKLSGVSGLMPWNWSERAKLDAKLNKLSISATPANAIPPRRHAVPSADESGNSELRFLEPPLPRVLVAFFDDVRKLIEQPDGLALSDATLVTDDHAEGTRAHRVVLAMRCSLMRQLFDAEAGPRYRIAGIHSRHLKHVIYFLYTDDLPPAVCEDPALRNEIAHQAHKLGIPDLAEACYKFGAIEESAAERLPPSLDTLVRLSDVTFMVGERKFELHRALLWARSAWFRALLHERWQGGCKNEIQVTSLTPEVFAFVVEYLYTGRAPIAPEIALDVLAAADMLGLPRLVHHVQLALQNVLHTQTALKFTDFRTRMIGAHSLTVHTVDAGNAVPLHLTATTHGATLLAALCEFWIATDLPRSMRHAQWTQLDAAARARVEAEHKRMQELRKLPCLLAPIVSE